MSAQQNQLKDITEADFSTFVNSYTYVPVRTSQWAKVLFQQMFLFPVAFAPCDCLWYSCLKMKHMLCSQTPTMACLDLCPYSCRCPALEG